MTALSPFKEDLLNELRYARRPLTAVELADLMDHQANAVGKACGELRNTGLVTRLVTGKDPIYNNDIVKWSAKETT